MKSPPLSAKISVTRGYVAYEIASKYTDTNFAECRPTAICFECKKIFWRLYRLAEIDKRLSNGAQVVER